MVDRDIPEEMVEKAARMLSTVMSHDPDQWSWYVEHARDALAAALEGCAVVQLPEPAGVRGDVPGMRPSVLFDADGYVVSAIAADFGPCVNVRGGPILPPEEAEARAAALIAAAREARRLASGSGVGEQP